MIPLWLYDISSPGNELPGEKIHLAAVGLDTGEEGSTAHIQDDERRWENFGVMIGADSGSHFPR
jgi:hypothetical protein